VTEASVVATPYPGINSVLQEFLSEVRAILGRRFVGMYLEGSLAMGDFEPDKSEHGLVLAGPPPRTLIDPVQPSELREAVVGILREWWAPMLVEAPLLEKSSYRCYAVLTMSRMLYTIHHGAIVSKRVAARWAEEALDRRWTPLIRDALAHDVPPDRNETLAYIRYTCEYGNRKEAGAEGE
jgi:hypothetical protein